MASIRAWTAAGVAAWRGSSTSPWPARRRRRAVSGGTRGRASERSVDEAGMAGEGIAGGGPICDNDTTMSDGPKYRQRGYKDSEREERGGGGGASRGPQAPREKKEGPRGRGLGSRTESVFRCHTCGEKQLSVLSTVSPEE